MENEYFKLGKIITNIILSILLIVTLFAIYTEKDKVKEVMNGKNGNDPIKLLEAYEIETKQSCSCYPSLDSNSEFRFNFSP